AYNLRRYCAGNDLDFQLVHLCRLTLHGTLLNYVKQAILQPRRLLRIRTSFSDSHLQPNAHDQVGDVIQGEQPFVEADVRPDFPLSRIPARPCTQVEAAISVAHRSDPLLRLRNLLIRVSAPDADKRRAVHLVIAVRYGEDAQLRKRHLIADGTTRGY